MIAWKIPDRRDTSYLRLGQTLVSAALPVQGRARAGGPVNRVKRPLTEECKILERPSQLMHLAAQMSPTPRPINDGQHHHCRSQILLSQRYLDPSVRHRLRVTQGGPAVWHLAVHTYYMPAPPVLPWVCHASNGTPHLGGLSSRCPVLSCSVLFCRSVGLCVCPQGGGLSYL